VSRSEQTPARVRLHDAWCCARRRGRRSRCSASAEAEVARVFIGAVLQLRLVGLRVHAWSDRGVRLDQPAYRSRRAHGHLPSMPRGSSPAPGRRMDANVERGHPDRSRLGVSVARRAALTARAVAISRDSTPAWRDRHRPTGRGGHRSGGIVSVPPPSARRANETLEARFARWKDASAAQDLLWERRAIATATAIACAIVAWLAAAIYLG
jgi:hypothetical protein